MPRCPICDRVFQTEESQALPFCSERCRMIDLGRWLDEKHRLPIDPGEEEEEEKEEAITRDKKTC